MVGVVVGVVEVVTTKYANFYEELRKNKRIKFVHIKERKKCAEKNLETFSLWRQNLPGFAGE